MKLRILTALLLVATTAFANDATITIRQNSGNETILELSTNPVITFESEYMVVTNDFFQISIPLDDISDYVVADEATGISPITMDSQIVRGHVVFSGLPAGTPVYVHSLDGKVVSRQAAAQDGKADVNLEILPKGTFIISALKQSIKVNNK